MKLNKLHTIVGNAKTSSESLLGLTGSQRKLVLMKLAEKINSAKNEIMKANIKDVNAAIKEGKNKSFIERLTLNEDVIRSMTDSLKEIARAKDALFEVMEEKKRPSGIEIKKVRFPLGLLAIIFESRPNVTVDAFALAFKSGNAVILKGGKEIAETNHVLVGIIKGVLRKFKIKDDIIQNISGLEKKLTLALLRDKRIDCLIPRGGKGLIDFVKNNARIPIIETGASVVHTYVDKSADLKMARDVVANAKIRRVSICNALDVLIIHKDISLKFLKNISNSLIQNKVELRVDEKSYAFLRKLKYPNLKKASTSDFDTEFLNYILAVKTVNNFKDALEHVKKHGLGHSEAIITKNKKQAKQFFQEIDAACLYLNTSTQFSDGGEFGKAGEIGISTQKLHARGPFSFQELTTYKYLISSKGSVRA
ncbi:MAG: glutamate-5-semialdehyde dehydrogenase [Parcubacteria group bacterium]|jgi:glutamate-5-semialdehyde dehydrogenase